MRKTTRRQAKTVQKMGVVPATSTEMVRRPLTELAAITDVEVIAEHLHGYSWHKPSDEEAIAQLTPWLKLCQQTSPEIKKQDPSYIKGLETGQFFNSLTHEIYGKGPLRFNMIADHGRDCVRYEDRKVVEVDIPYKDPKIFLPGSNPNKAQESWTVTVYLVDHNLRAWHRAKNTAYVEFMKFLAKVRENKQNRLMAKKEALECLVNGTMWSHWKDEGPNKQYFIPMYDTDGLADGERRATVLRDVAQYAGQSPIDLVLNSQQSYE